MPLIIEGLGVPPEARTRLFGNAEERKDFARDIRRMLAAAEEAKAAGYLSRPELKLQMELARAFVIAQAYFKQRQDAGDTTPKQVVTARRSTPSSTSRQRAPSSKHFFRTTRRIAATRRARLRRRRKGLREITAA